MSTPTGLEKPLKTWSHLASARKRPTEYEMVSANILWNTPNSKLKWTQGAQTPIVRWRAKNRNESPIKHDDWNAFRDPDQLVYRTYNLMQDGQETYVDGLLNEYNSNQHDLSLSTAWLEILARAYTPARYVVHATQMALGYLVALAPSSTIANPLMFECGDQLRWLSRIAYRTAELAKAHPDLEFGKAERKRWEEDPMWEGFLELVERTLVTWDWNEAFVVVHLILKPAIDEAFMHQFGQASRMSGDLLTGMLLDAQYVDSERSRRFGAAVVSFLCKDEQYDNRKIIDEWLRKWSPLGDRAIERFCSVFDDGKAAAEVAKAKAKEFRQSVGLN
jgi:toluene monooxygenase system protein E